MSALPAVSNHEGVTVNDATPSYYDMTKRWTGYAIGLVAISVVLVFLIWFAGASVGRFQARQDAANRVKVSAIEIRNQAQRVKIARQKAEIRLQDAIGVRHAQDEIAKTLTPLYVQFEMVDALRRIAESGRNNTVVYVPSGANGIPLVSTVNPDTVGAPQP